MTLIVGTAVVLFTQANLISSVRRWAGYLNRIQRIIRSWSMYIYGLPFKTTYFIKVILCWQSAMDYGGDICHSGRNGKSEVWITGKLTAMENVSDLDRN